MTQSFTIYDRRTCRPCAEGITMRFSERLGLKSPRSIIQTDSMDDELQNSLWNALHIFYWEIIPQNITFDYFGSRSNYYKSQGERAFGDLLKSIWIDLFKIPINDIPDNWRFGGYSEKTTYEEIKKYYFSCTWYERYEFIEFVPNNYEANRDSNPNKKFMEYCNNILKRELSAYRFVNGNIAKITSEEEIASIEESITIQDQFKAVSVHMKQALALFVDRKSPDYRNSIKESISAVEAMCKIITGDDKATLATALKKLDINAPVHPALKKAFESLYGYAGDAGGIRHALSEESNLKFEDAKFMLVACSAFINYLQAKLT